MDRLEMNCIVCVKQIPDPEIPPSKFKLDEESKRVIPPEGIPPVMNPYDEQAVELALRLKDKYGGRITVITLGNEEASTIIKHALAMGADEGAVLDNKIFKGWGSFSTAYILSQAIKKIGSYDLVLCGRQAADWDEGLVGTIIAGNLALPLVTLAEEVEWADGELRIKRVILDGHQIFAVPAPALITVSNEVGRPRLPSGWGIISASQKKIPVWKAVDIDVDPSRTGVEASRRKLTKLFIPEQKRKCEILEAETVTEAAAKLAERLIKAGIL